MLASAVVGVVYAAVSASIAFAYASTLMLIALVVIAGGQLHSGARDEARV